MSIGVSINEWSIQIFKESIQTIMSSSVDMYPKVKYFHLQEETLSGYNSCYSVSQKQFLESGCKSGVQTSYLASDIRSEVAMGLKTIFYYVISMNSWSMMAKESHDIHWRKINRDRRKRAVQEKKLCQCWELLMQPQSLQFTVRE